MSNWVLLVYVEVGTGTYHSGGPTVIPGFSTKENAIKAGEKFKTGVFPYGWSVQYFCVELEIQ